MTIEAPNNWFIQQLRMVLTHLYDPSVLRNNALVTLFGLEQRHNTVTALRTTLTEAIESLRPTQSTPVDAKSWRVYQVLRRRYIEQVSQREVAADLGLSVRQLQREEKAARQVLADYLWNAYHLDESKLEVLTGNKPSKEPISASQSPTPAQELEWLRTSVPLEKVDVGEVIEETLKTIAPLQMSMGVTITYNRADESHHLLARLPLLRQALVNILSEAIGISVNGSIDIQVIPIAQHLEIYIRAHQNQSPQSHKVTEGLEMAENLLQLCRGSMERLPLSDKEIFAVKLTFVGNTLATILVIDDNADTLQLFQRYLSGSQYRFIGTQNAAEGFTLAQELSPQVIILDVMMPEQDGWAVLGQFREHPKTQDALIIICTILPQEELALTLGAGGFLRKPVSRTTLLSTLDHHFDPPSIASD